MNDLYNPATVTFFKELKDLVQSLGGCDHEVGICYCAIKGELEAAEAIAKGMMATASIGYSGAGFLEEVRKAVAALRSLGVPEHSQWGQLVMYQVPVPVLDVPEVDNDGINLT